MVNIVYICIDSYNQYNHYNNYNFLIAIGFKKVSSVIYSYMNVVKVSDELELLLKSERVKKKPSRDLKEIEKAIKDFEDEYGCLKNGRQKNPVPIPPSEHKLIYKKIAEEFDLPELMDNEGRILWLWKGGEGRRILAYLDSNEIQIIVFLLKFFGNHKNYEKYCGY